MKQLLSFIVILCATALFAQDKPKADKMKMEKEKMGSFLCVAQGTPQDPRLVAIEYRGGPAKQAPVVLVSMTASSADELPRGLDFLFSTNRLNVAISRAQWAAYVVHSPALADVTPNTPHVMRLLGGFLGVVARG